MSESAQRGHTAIGRRFPHIRMAYIVLLALMALFAWKFIARTEQVRRLSAQQAALVQANGQLEAQNTQMRRNIKYYGTPSYIEDQARSLLGYVRPGEVAVEVQPARASHPEMHAAPRAPVPTPLPVWRQWVNAFVH